LRVGRERARTGGTAKGWLSLVAMVFAEVHLNRLSIIPRDYLVVGQFDVAGLRCSGGIWRIWGEGRVIILAGQRSRLIRRTASGAALDDMYPYLSGQGPGLLIVRTFSLDFAYFVFYG
jgi:hypothetical protein